MDAHANAKSQQTLPARYYARFCDVLQQLGAETGPLLATAGVARAEIQAPEAQLTLDQVEALVAAAEQTTQCTDLALELARALKLTSHSSVSYGILSSPTGGYALHLVARFFSLILPAFRMRYTANSRHMQIFVTPVWAMSHACLAFHLELIAACVHWELRELVGGSLPPYDIHFSLDEPPHVQRYVQLREARVHFGWQGRPGFRMTWPVEVARRPVSLADPTALKLAEQRCSEMLAHARHTGNIGEWIGMMLNEASGGLPSLTELAGALNLSSRTLDRYLKREGYSYRELGKKVLYGKACVQLRNTALPITQIALDLGYTDVSNFARAFRRESGMSPSAWRTRHAADR